MAVADVDITSLIALVVPVCSVVSWSSLRCIRKNELHELAQWYHDSYIMSSLWSSFSLSSLLVKMQNIF